MEIYEVLLLTTSYKINMEQYINTTDIVEYKENKIDDFVTIDDVKRLIRK